MTKRKENTKAAAKTAPKKTVTMAERLTRIERDINELMDRAKVTHALQTTDHDHLVQDALPALRYTVDKLDRIESKVSDDAAFRLFVQSLVKERNETGPRLDKIEATLTSIAEEAMRASTMAHHARTNSRGNTVILNKLQSDLSLLLSGASFMQELEQAKPTEEQGLEPGDYTDASKEVADELTAMGYQWKSGDRTEWNHIGWNGEVIDNDGYPPRATRYKQIDQAEFLSRARVTAKRLGLVPVEQPKPWKPEVDSLVALTERSMFFEAGHVDKVLHVDEDGDVFLPHPDYRNGACVDKKRVRKPTPEEVAKHKEEQELAKPIVHYETKVMFDKKEWRVIAGPDKDGDYTLHLTKSDGMDSLLYKGRDQFTVIP